MDAKKPVHERSPQGVYYARDDYAGFWRRLVVDLIDFTALGLAAFFTTVVAALLLPVDKRGLTLVLFWSASALGFLYLVLLKRSRFRTLGYRVGGLRIVSLQGERPSLWSLTIRALFAFFGPFNLLIDVIWLTSDERRQALRDKFAHTYVIRDRAVPLASGPITYVPYTLFGASFVFAEVRPKGGEVPSAL
jgi:uncharacterized RDD family membrane protein YckC